MVSLKKTSVPSTNAVISVRSHVTIKLMWRRAAAALFLASSRSRWSSSPRQVAEGGSSSGSVAHRACAFLRSAPSHTAGKTPAINAMVATCAVSSSETISTSNTDGRLRRSLAAAWRKRDADIRWRVSTSTSSRTTCAFMWHADKLANLCARTKSMPTNVPSSAANRSAAVDR